MKDISMVLKFPLLKRFKGINLKILCTIVLMLYAILMSGPWLPSSFASSLDESFVIALHKVFQTDIQFGKDFIYTYGPYGILQSSFYFPETYHYLLAGRILTAIAFALSLSSIIYHCWKNAKISVVFLIPFVAFFINSNLEINAFYLTVITLPLVIYFYVNEGKIDYILLLSLAVVALTGLIKFTYLTLGFAFIFLIGIDEIFHRRRLPIVTLFYLLITLIFWMLAGQNLGNINTYLSNSSEIVKGFQKTMGLPGPASEIYWYLVSMGAFTTLVFATTWKYRNRFYLLPAIGLLLLSFLIFKASFVRHDLHAIIAAYATVPIACLFTALMWSDIKRINLKIKALKTYIPIILIAWVLIILNASILFNNYYSYQKISYGQYYLNTFTKVSESFTNFLNLITGKTDLKTISETSLSQIRSNNPMPEMSGKSDMYNNEIGTLFAYGLPYQPRPVIQSFSAYTSKLAEINKQHLLSDKAPETILFNLQPIDGRLPSSEDGLSWPELLTRYEIKNLTGKYPLFKRIDSPRTYSIVPIKNETIKMGEWLDIQDSGSIPLWMQVNIAPTKTGQLISSIFKLPPLYVEVETIRNAVEKYRVFPELMSSGQLLSPLIKNNDDFVLFAHAQWSELLKNNFIKRIRLLTQKGDAFAYPQTYSISLGSLEFPRQKFSDVPGWKSPYETNLNVLNPDNAVNYQSQSFQLIKEDGHYALWAHAPSKLDATIPTKAQKLAIAYGILGAVVEQATKSDVAEISDGVEFRILLLNSDGQEEILFSSSLNPIFNASDRGVKKAEIDLTNKQGKKIIIETLPGENASWDWSYWSEIMFK